MIINQKLYPHSKLDLYSKTLIEKDHIINFFHFERLHKILKFYLKKKYSILLANLSKNSCLNNLTFGMSFTRLRADLPTNIA